MRRFNDDHGAKLLSRYLRQQIRRRARCSILRRWRHSSELATQQSLREAFDDPAGRPGDLIGRVLDQRAEFGIARQLNPNRGA